MELKVQSRTILGKKTKALRKKGWIPVELYGHNIANKHLQILEKDFEKIYKTAGEHTIVNIIIENDEKIPIIIKKAVRDSMSRKYIAVDLLQIRMDEEIQTKVPIEFVGESPALKKGLIVVKVLNELEIKALPKNIPHLIKVELTPLEALGDKIHIKDISIPKEIKVLVPSDTIISAVIEKTAEKETPLTTPVESPTADSQTPTKTPESAVKETEKNEQKK